MTNADPVARAGLNQLVDEGTTVFFDASSSTDRDGDALSYHWDFGDGDTATGAQLAHVFEDNGVYPVTLTMDDGHGGAGTDSVAATVRNVAPTVTSVVNDGPVLPGDPVTITVTASDVAGDPLSYEFDFDGDGVADESNSTGVATYSFPTDGIYPVNVRVLDGDGGVSSGWNAVQVGSGEPTELPVVSFDVTGQTAPEGDGAVTVRATLDTLCTHQVLVPLTLGGTADDSDIELPFTYLLFAAGQMERTVEIRLTDDPIDEDVETVTLEMGTPWNASLGSIVGYTLTIEDNDDAPYVMFTSTGQEADEDAGPIVVTARLTDASGAGVTSGKQVLVPFAVTGTADPAADYSFLDGAAIVIPPGQYTGTATILVYDDALPERNETIILGMSLPTNADLSPLPGTTTVHAVTIPSNDAPSVSFTSAYRRVDETVGTVTLTAKLSSPFYEQVDVLLTVTGDASARYGGPADPQDFTLSPVGPIHFDVGQTTATVGIAVVDDLVAEDSEQLVLRMVSPTNAMLGATSRYVLEIKANDSPVVTFGFGPTSGWEDAGSIPFSIAMTNRSDEPVTVPVVVYGGSASNGVDYVIATPTVTIPAGLLSATGELTIKNDLLNESHKTVNLALLRPDNARLGEDVYHSITIKDDDPLVNISGSRASYDEDKGPMTFTVSLSAATNKTVTVPLEYPGFRGEGWRSSISISPSDPDFSVPLQLLIEDDEVYGKDYWGEVRIGSGVTNALVGPERESSFRIKDAQSPPVVNLSLKKVQPEWSKIASHYGAPPQYVTPTRFNESEEGAKCILEMSAASQNLTVVTVRARAEINCTILTFEA